MHRLHGRDGGSALAQAGIELFLESIAHEQHVARFLEVQTKDGVLDFDAVVALLHVHVGDAVVGVRVGILYINIGDVGAGETQRRFVFCQVVVGLAECLFGLCVGTKTLLVKFYSLKCFIV